MRKAIAVCLAWLVAAGPALAWQAGTSCDCGCGSWTVPAGSSAADCTEFCMGGCNPVMCNTGGPIDAPTGIPVAMVCGCDCDGIFGEDTAPIAWDEVCCNVSGDVYTGACAGMGTCQQRCDCDEDGLWECEGDCGCSCESYCLECDCDGDGIYTSPGCGTEDLNGDGEIDCVDVCCIDGGEDTDSLSWPLPCGIHACVDAESGECYTSSVESGCDVDGDGICDGTQDEDGNCADCSCVDRETMALNPAGFDADGDGYCDLEEAAGDCCNLGAEIESRITEFKEIFDGILWPEEMALDLDEWEDYCVDIEMPWFGGTTETFQICLMPDTSTPLGAGFDNFRLVARGIMSGVFALLVVGKVWTVLRQY